MLTLKDLQQTTLTPPQTATIQLFVNMLDKYYPYFKSLAANAGTNHLKEYLTLRDDLECLLSSLSISNGNCNISDILSFRRSINLLSITYCRLNPNCTHPLNILFINMILEFDKIIDLNINEKLID